MLPTNADTLHVRSGRVLVDGAVGPATVLLDLADGAATVRTLQVGILDDAALDLGDALLVPAPLDLHFHGAGGHVVPPGGDPRVIDDAIDARLQDSGWHHELARPRYEWLATLPVPQLPVPDPLEHLAAAAEVIARSGPSGCVGLRIEGLFLNPARAGVWPPETFMTPDPSLLAELHAAARDAGSPLRVIDVAPELPRALDVIERARELGMVASLAHTDATWEQARAAIDAGATLATHTWNAMRPVAHRDPGVVAAVLADPRVTCELICDGVHLHPGTIELSVAACGPGRWVAISDASPFAGCAPGEYDWAGTTVRHDGVALRDPDGHLAGSASLLDAAVPTLRSAGVDDVAIVAALGAVPRRVLEPSRPLGLRAGDPAWIVPSGIAAEERDASTGIGRKH